MKVAVILPAGGPRYAYGQRRRRKDRHQPQAVHAARRLAHPDAHGAQVRRFATRVSEIVVAVRAEDLEWVGGMLAARVSRAARCAWWKAATAASNRWRTRWRSLGPDTDLVAVHDAVRPFIDLETIDKVFDEAAETGAAIVGRAAGGYRQAGEPRHRPRAHPRHPAARKAGDGADAAGVPLRPAEARLRDGARRRLHRHRRSQPGGTAGRGGERGAWAATAISRSPSRAIWIWPTCSSARKSPRTRK